MVVDKNVSIGSYLSSANSWNLQFSWPPHDWELGFVVTPLICCILAYLLDKGRIECYGNLQKQKGSVSVLSMVVEGFYRG